MKPEFIVDKTGQKKKVILSLKEFKQLMETMEDLEDTIAGLKIKLAKNPKFYSLEQVEKEINEAK